MVRFIQNRLAEAAIQSRDEFRQFQLLLLCEAFFSQTMIRVRIDTVVRGVSREPSGRTFGPVGQLS